jgi:hypothetical protein
MVQLLYGNAASLSITLGGGQHGHIGLIMTLILYATLANMPGTTPNYAPATASETAAMQETQQIQHKEEGRIYEKHQNMNDALKSQVIDTINDTYLCELRNKYTGYLGVSIRYLFDHLLNRYGKITPADIESCKRHMNDPIDSTQPINIYFQKVNNCVQYAADRQVGFTSDQILQTAYHAISTSETTMMPAKNGSKNQPTKKPGKTSNDSMLPNISQISSNSHGTTGN